MPETWAEEVDRLKREREKSRAWAAEQARQLNADCEEQLAADSRRRGINT